MCEAQFPRGSLLLEVTRGFPSWWNNRAGKMVQQVKTPVTQLSGLSSIPGTHTIGELIPTSSHLTSTWKSGQGCVHAQEHSHTHIHIHTHAHTCTHTLKRCKESIKQLVNSPNRVSQLVIMLRSQPANSVLSPSFSLFLFVSFLRQSCYEPKLVLNSVFWVPGSIIVLSTLDLSQKTEKRSNYSFLSAFLPFPTIPHTHPTLAPVTERGYFLAPHPQRPGINSFSH